MMKHIFMLLNANKTRLTLVISIIIQALFLVSTPASGANDYLEKQKNYQVYASGVDCIHFKIPVWSRGFYHYYTTENSYVFYKLKGSDEEQKILWYKTDSYGLNENNQNDKGSAYIKFLNGMGNIIVTSMFDGTKKNIPDNDQWSNRLDIIQINDCDQTILEFDWYPPENLNEKEFIIGIHVDSERSKQFWGAHHWSKTFIFSQMFRGNNNMITPQLFTPYLYQVYENGTAGYGQAGIIYTTFYPTLGYSTSLTPHDTLKTTNRSEHIFVMTNDTVQEEFYADFKVYRNETLGTTTIQRSTSVDIPPYHRIYNFRAKEETDSTGTFTGNNVLQWDIKNPALRDIVNGDYFEIQRSFKSDFSDAKQLTIVPMKRDSIGIYNYIDNSRETWTGNATIRTDTIDTRLSTQVTQYTLYDANNNPLAELSATLTSEHMKFPAVPVYYRIRRASSSIWGWDNEFARDVRVFKKNYLAPLAETQEPYTLDADYGNNHKVNFRIRLENKDVTPVVLEKEQCTLDYSIDKVLKEGNVDVTVQFKQGEYCYDPAGYTKFRVIDDEGNVLVDWEFLSAGTYQWPYNSTVSVQLFDQRGYAKGNAKSVRVKGKGKIVSETYWSMGTENIEATFHFEDDAIIGQVAALAHTVKDSLYNMLVRENNISYGKCMWDKTAKLLLVRTIQETGQSREFIIPHDSIRRQADGSWIASYSDIADKACQHYQYAVRIDQTGSDLHLQTDEQLKPITLTGPDIYYDEGAKITHFFATKGDVSSELKTGVLLNWQPSSSAVDRYLLQRRELNSDAVADTIYQGTDNAYFDVTALPDVHYEYTITALYDCNGKFTSNYATTEGWRTPYGEISGCVQMSDYSGMSGTTVVLQGPDGNVIRTMITDASGTYKFDSLTYDISSSTNYVVVPSHQYGQFSFNNTSSGTAAITLSKDNAVASGINFVNTSTTRLTGRILYKNTTIPVVGAMFLLNGDTVRHNSSPLTSGIDGSFALVLSKSQPYKLQVFKPGHVFEGGGILRVEGEREEFALTKPLDGVRFYDETKVRLVGRVAGGNDQRDLPEAFGIGNNNLGDNLQLVLQLEGDNTAQIVHDPIDPLRDTIMQHVEHIVHIKPSYIGGDSTRIVGNTHTLFEKKRIIIKPDPNTGEFEVDLFPVKYKVIQASAQGYATLFLAGQGSETFDLTEAPLTEFAAIYRSSSDSVYVNGQAMNALPWGSVIYDGDSVHYNARYDRIYHNAVEVELVQNIYGIERAGFGEPEMEVSSYDIGIAEKVQLYTVREDGTAEYLLGYPVFNSNRKYQFKAKAYEDYYYNNNQQTGRLDRVPQRGGSVTIHNGLHNSNQIVNYLLDQKGQNNNIWLDVDNVDVEHAGTAPLRNVSIALETEGNTVETNVFSAYISGTVIEEEQLHSTPAHIKLIDIVRDPGGAGSSAYIESGSTYNFSYSMSSKSEIGVKLTPTWGLNVSTDVGIIALTGATGTYTGSNVTSSKSFSFDIPISHTFDYGMNYSCTFTTNDRIETSSSGKPSGVGSNADVFMGTTVSQISGKAKTISIINDTIYQMMQPALQAGAMLELASGTNSEGKAFHLVTGTKVVLGSRLENTFVYTQNYIVKTLIPNLAIERQNLLRNFPDSASAQSAANSLGKPVYWYHETGSYLNDTLPRMTYEMITPYGKDDTWNDEVAAYNNMIIQWLKILIYNEQEKVASHSLRPPLGTYSVSSGTSYKHSDSWSATGSYNEVPLDMIMLEIANSELSTLTSFLGSCIGAVFNGFFKEGAQFGTSAAEALQQFYNDEEAFIGMDDEGNMFNGGEGKQQKPLEEIGTVTNVSKFKMNFTPISNSNRSKRITTAATINKKAGFTIGADPLGDITVTVYQAEYDSTWLANSKAAREYVDQANNGMLNYASYVFFTEAGMTSCPHEDEERTKFYNAGTLLGNNTAWVSKPELAANTYEIANVAPDKHATFRISLYNQGQADTGAAAEGTGFYLFLDGASNPDGAKVYINGAPLNQSLYYWIQPGTPIVQTLEVERGTVDDYNLTLGLYIDGCPKSRTTMNLAVHFMPVSTDVEITQPRQNWVMNTLSQHDSIGYYLPVEIEEFDIHHKNFDHIEFQYKLSTESGEKWVNQCSFYANDSLYALATGNKAMIENGRIIPFRFYGERDPMEQRYDLRAVSFCRYGSGFVSKSSPVISGVKDTRPPQVFGYPEPANSILGIGDNLMLRFSEPIAGNYLDEDNNFQLVGVTNETGIAAGTALHFNSDSKAETKVKRDIIDKSFSIDMMLRPDEANRSEDMKLFEMRNTTSHSALEVYLTKDNRICVKPYAQNTFGNMYSIYPIYSKPLGSLLEYSRIVITIEREPETDHCVLHVYSGNMDMTDYSGNSNLFPWPIYTTATTMSFGNGYRGDMLETRIWTKALTQEEISATAGHYLTGYERELLAYYRMNEGKGETVSDRANGATLFLEGTSWNKQEGFSLALDGTSSVKLDGNLLGRSAVYDGTLMFWFKPESNGTLFSAANTSLSLENGKLIFQSGDKTYSTSRQIDNNEWHYLVLTINRTFDNAALFVDGDMLLTIPAHNLEGITGGMYLGGDGFKGNIDEFTIFEQALPQSLVETYYNIAINGDEMGLVGYLPFEEQKLNPNGILEQVFSINDQRVYKNMETGEVIDKVVPLVLSSNANSSVNNAPTSDYGQLSKLRFNWSFNSEELMINVLNQDREVNKQSMYITVRDVEDLNGNPMQSPVTWTAFVDRNSLKWEDDDLDIYHIYGQETAYNYVEIQIVNNSGMRHQYTIESLPDWLKVDQSYGSINQMQDKAIRFTYDTDMPVGEYMDIVYLTDENGLSEPLEVEYIVEAFPPYSDIDRNKYPLNMSVCGQVIINDAYDTDENDIVYAIYKNECIGKENVSFDNISNLTTVYLTIYGNDQMNGKNINFVLWQASTGNTLNLMPDQPIKFKTGDVIGCGNGALVKFNTSNYITQSINLNAGWNWTSFNLNLQPATATISKILTANAPWSEGDIIKNPATQHFVTYSAEQDEFVGMFGYLRYIYTYMIYCKNGNTMHVNGISLPADSMHITLRGNGQWNAFPCYLQTATSVTEALSDYYNNATEGDVIKGQNSFAYFSANGKWEGNLKTIRPGEGYFLRRMGQGNVDVNIYNRTSSNARRRNAAARQSETPLFRNPNAANNMTMIAKVVNMEEAVNNDTRVLAYVGSELSGIASPQIVENDTLFFITISSDIADYVTFRIQQNGEVAGTTAPMFTNAANDHRGTVEAPVPLLFQKEKSITYPTNVRFYSATGKIIGELKNAESEQQIREYLNSITAAAGLYNAVLESDGIVKTIKMIKR